MPIYLLIQQSLQARLRGFTMQLHANLKGFYMHSDIEHPYQVPDEHNANGG